MSFGTATSFYSDLMSECKNLGTDPDTYGAMMVTNGSLRAAVDIRRIEISSVNVVGGQDMETVFTVLGTAACRCEQGGEDESKGFVHIWEVLVSSGKTYRLIAGPVWAGRSCRACRRPEDAFSRAWRNESRLNISVALACVPMKGPIRSSSSPEGVMKWQTAEILAFTNPLARGCQ